MSITGNLFGGNSDPDDPEDKIERDEQKVVKHLENIDRRLNQILQDEEDLIESIDEGGNKRRIKTQLSNIEIALEQDMQNEESSIADQIDGLRQEERRMNEERLMEDNLVEPHRELLNLLESIIPELHDEVQRLEELVMAGNKHIRSGEIDYNEAHKKLQEHVRKDQNEALDLKNKIEKAAELEKKIVEEHS